MAERTSVTIEIARAPWFLEAGLIEPAPSLERWKAKLAQMITTVHPRTDVQFVVNPDVSREQEYRVVYDTSRDEPRTFTLGASVWAMAHDLTVGKSWCVYRTYANPPKARAATDPLRDDLDIGMERIRREEEELREQEETGWTNAG
jgi:hypothetical protein